MIEESFWITDRFGEKLEAILRKPKKTGKFPAVVFVSGLGMDLHEWNNSFDEISKRLVKQGYLTLQFSFSGCGNSEGDYVDMTFTRQGQQIEDVLRWLEKQNSIIPKRIGIVAQSCGVASVLGSDVSGVKSLLFISGAFNAFENLKRTFTERKAYNPTGISAYPRSSGKINNFGPQFWQDLTKRNETKLIREIVSPVFVVHGTKDTYIPYGDAIEAFKFFPNPKKKIKIFEDGDHGIEEDVSRSMREEFINEVTAWFKETI